MADIAELILGPIIFQGEETASSRKEDKMEEGDADAMSSVNKMEKEMKELRSEVRELTAHMKKVLDTVERIETLSLRVDRNEKKVQKVEEEVKKIDEKVKGGVEEMIELKESNAKLLERVKSVEERMDSQEAKGGSRVKKLEERVTGQEEKSVDMEARARRNNSVFHGVKELANETEEDCKKTVQRIIKEECKVQKDVIIERAHRIPPGPHNKRRSSDKPRPLIVKFLDYNDRMAVKAGRVNIPAESGIGISDDLPLAIRQARRGLNSDLQKARDQGRNCFVTYPAKLFIDGVLVREEPIRAEDNLRRGGDNQHGAGHRHHENEHSQYRRDNSRNRGDYRDSSHRRNSYRDPSRQRGRYNGRDESYHTQNRRGYRPWP